MPDLITVFDLQTKLQEEVNTATTWLEIAPIVTVVKDGDIEANTAVGLRSISLGREFLKQLGRAVEFLTVYSEVAQICVADREQVLGPHDNEKARDLIAGWLCGMRGLSIGADETFAPTYGASILELANNAPLHLRVAVVLGLDASCAGGGRATNVLTGWLAARSGQPYHLVLETARLERPTAI